MQSELITALGNEEGYLEVSFNKSKTFYHFLVHFFFYIHINYKIDYESDGIECNPLDCVDYWEEFKTERYHVELFYGKEKVIMIIRSLESHKKKVSNYLLSNCKFLSPKKEK